MDQAPPQETPGVPVVVKVMTILPAVAIPLVWSAGIAGWIIKDHHLSVPLLALALPVAILLIALMLVLARGMRSRPGRWLGPRLGLILLLPLYPTFFGGLYCWLVQKYTNAKSWAATGGLCLGLAVTIFGFGLATHTAFLHSLAVFIPAAGLVCLFRWIMRCAPLGLMSFGFLHLIALLAASCVAASEDAQRKSHVAEVPVAASLQH